MLNIKSAKTWMSKKRSIFCCWPGGYLLSIIVLEKCIQYIIGSELIGDNGIPPPLFSKVCAPTNIQWKPYFLKLFFQTSHVCLMIVICAFCLSVTTSINVYFASCIFGQRHLTVSNDNHISCNSLIWRIQMCI